MGLASELITGLDHVSDWGLLATDADLIVTGWNRWLEQRTGLSCRDVLGRPLFQVFPELVTRRLDRYYRQALAGQTAILAQRFHKYILPMPASVDAPGLAQMQQTGRIVPLGEEGAVRGTLTVIEDVTERVAYEAELKSRARQQTALASLARQALAGGGAAVVAREVLAHVGEAIGADFAEVLEFHPGGQTWTRLAGTGWGEPNLTDFASAAAPRTTHALRSVSAGAAEDIASDSWITSDTHLRSHGIAGGLVVRVPGRPDQPFGLLGVYTRERRRFSGEEVLFVQALADILGVAAERKRLEGELRLRVDELAQADRRKDEFLAMLAHELRNPLAPIRNATQILLMKNHPDPEFGFAVMLIERQLQQMTRLVDDLLDVSRITRGKVNLEVQPVQVAAVVERALETSRPLIDARQHRLTVALPPAGLCVKGDPVRLSQVASNLLNNAAKYTEEGGQIDLVVERDGGEAVIRVRDTGVGIAPAMLRTVFDLFMQAQGSVSRSEGGLGIGLSLVRGLVEMHGGSVTAHSDGLGRGSEFVVRLPLLAETAVPVATEGTVPANRRTVPANRILVVDDNRDAAESLTRLLRLSGHDVRMCHDGHSALDVARSWPAEVVLLDIGLPGMDGLEVCRRLRGQSKGNQPLIVAMTGYGQDEDRRQSEAAGFNAHMVKPLDLAVLQELLSRPELSSRSRG